MANKWKRLLESALYCVAFRILTTQKRTLKCTQTLLSIKDMKPRFHSEKTDNKPGNYTNAVTLKVKK